MTYAPAKFEVDMSNGLGGNAFTQYLKLYSVNMTYNLKKTIIQWESVCICICLHPRRGSLSAQCVVLLQEIFDLALTLGQDYIKHCPLHHVTY